MSKKRDALTYVKIKYETKFFSGVPYTLRKFPGVPYTLEITGV